MASISQASQVRGHDNFVASRLRREWHRRSDFDLSVGDLVKTDGGAIVSFQGISTHHSGDSSLGWRVQVLGYPTKHTVETAKKDGLTVMSLPPTFPSYVAGNVPVVYRVDQRTTPEAMADNYQKLMAATMSDRQGYQARY